MKTKKIIALASLSFALVFSIAFVNAQGTGELLFQDSFSESATKWQSVSGAWGWNSIEQNYQQVSLLEAEQWAFAGFNDWTDYVYEVKVRLDQGSLDRDIGIGFRVQDSNNMYQFAFGNAGDDVVGLAKKVNGRWSSIEANKYYPKTAGVWYKLKVSVEGSSIKAYVNDELVFDAIDYTFAKGRIGLKTYGTWASFDDAKVTALAVRVVEQGPVFKEPKVPEIFPPKIIDKVPPPVLDTGLPQEATIAALAANPSAYDGKTVIVTGTVKSKTKLPSFFGVSLGNQYVIADESGNTVSFGYLGDIDTTALQGGSGLNVNIKVTKVVDAKVGNKVKVTGKYSATGNTIGATKMEKIGGFELSMLWIIIIVVIVVVVVIVALYFFIMRKPSGGVPSAPSAAPVKVPPKAPPAAAPKKGGAPPPAPKK